ncbi:MAG: hypothetical protein HY716_02990 [Planctomycetes bacterium]|nr:hypothetical protein [Planctomycetota bacterium]
MIIKKFKGPNEKAVLERIRTELGEEAVILHTVFVRPRGLARWFQRPCVEIVAGGGFRIIRDYPHGSMPVSPTTIVRPAPAPAISTDDLKREIAEIKEMIARRTRAAGLPGQTPELREEYAALASASISDSLARTFFERIAEKLPAAAMRDRVAVHEAMRAAIKSAIQCADGIQLEPGRCVRVAFIGPTGVGKTTTIAKLLSIYAYRGRSVAVITTDTYRIAAAEQVRRVAHLAGVPVRVCGTVPELHAALEEFKDRDLVLLDTAGRSQKDGDKIEDLCALLRAVQPDETHLVLSSVTDSGTLVDAVKRFSPCGFTKVVFTKLDEAVKVGIVLDVLSKVDTRLSFITTGQEIPRDIEVADSERLTSLILGEEGV